MKTALYVARIIHNDLVITNATSWQWWTALSQCNFKDGLVYLDDGETDGKGMKDAKYDGRYMDSKLLWTLGNYSRFVRPGMVRVKCDVLPNQSIKNGVLASAYKGNNGNFIVVLVNLSSEIKHAIWDWLKWLMFLSPRKRPILKRANRAQHLFNYRHGRLQRF